MAYEAPSWADQWDAGGIGAMEGDYKTTINEGNGSKKKADSGSGLGKAKAVATAGAQKVKTGTSTGIKWIKKQFQKKNSSIT
ncbi:hypothetical protein RHGRI_037246 [Rhododendron griersonianum]|uniref:CDP-diacylglycerol-glycerol-3-phosphate 3-phosphatidyltransferase n=1 Tax=Rhododendron griersonianum TaxID=479676 RepID=A0AAV6HR23_9ERIC|nr:hypothetical protein RHGRI_037246 [Rhododendron griersonianum]